MRQLLKKGSLVAVLCLGLVAVILCGCSAGGSLVAESFSRESVDVEAVKQPLPEPEKENETAKSAESPLLQEKGQGTEEKTVEKPEADTSLPVDTETQNEIKGDTVGTKEDNFSCTLSIKCDAVLDNMAKLNSQKTEVIPANGVIFPEETVLVYEGESVFNVLLRETKKNKIHIDFVNTPAYNTAYIKGIANLYERDCGETSGWMYLVNGSVPGCGCSQYVLKPGDRIEWVYTCNPGDIYPQNK